MNSKEPVLSNEPTRQKRLSLWPGIIIVILQWLIRFVIPVFVPDALVYGVFGGIILGLAIIIWWAFFSRAHRFDRWAAPVLIIIALLATSRILHVSIATANMGMMFVIFSIPVMSLAFVVWAVLSRRLRSSLRRATMLATIILASGFWALLRTNGVTGDLHHDLEWRWAKTSEERFLSQFSNEPMTLPAATETGAIWPGFRGPNRDGIIHGVRIKTDWKASPPVELWRRPIGPGCSSFAIGGGLFYTQEQRGDNEVVSCYNLTTGKPVWLHNDKARFWDSHAGAGPRATPTLFNGRIYTCGATGILNVLDARDGSVVWSCNAASDTKAKNSGWGFTGSPLVVDSNVLVAVSGQLAAYDAATGKPRWFREDSSKSYSSPHLLTIDGIAQILMMSDAGTISFAPSNGKVLWKYRWPVMDRILQPALTSDGDLILNGSLMDGMRRITVAHESNGWKIKERWTSNELKPYFNDFIIHKGHVYGFNGKSLACIDIKDGKRNWSGGRYGGQIILLADQDIILVLSEKGELALVAADPSMFTELASFAAIKGKTWNHPVLVGDVLLIRNNEEMVAFRISLAGG